MDNQSDNSGPSIAKFANSAVSNLCDFKQNGFMCDFIIKMDDTSIIFKCHRIVLAANIPYFYALFDANLNEAKDGAVVIKQIPTEDMSVLIDFAYSGKVELTPENISGIFHAASRMQMEDLCLICDEFLIKICSVDNAFDILSLSNQLGRLNLNCYSKQFIFDNFEQIMMSEKFLEIDFNMLSSIIESSDLTVASENQVYQAVMRWIEVDKDNRLSYLPTLLENVRLCQLKPVELKTISKHKYIKNNTICSELINDALKCQSHSNSRSTSMTAGSSNRKARKNMKQQKFASKCHNFDVCRPRNSAGIIICAGGDGPLNSVEIFDIHRNCWAMAAPMATQRACFGLVTTASGKIFAIGGSTGGTWDPDSHGQFLASVEMFDINKNEWTAAASMNTPRRTAAYGCLDDTIYAVGGYSGGGILSSVEKLNTAEKEAKWRNVANLLTPRTGPAVAALNGQLIIGGGLWHGYLSSCERYDPNSNEWSAMPSMIHRRAESSMIAFNGCLYVFGGRADYSEQHMSACEKYDPATNRWNAIQAMSGGRGWLKAVTVNDTIVVVGGQNDQKILDSVAIYDPRKDKWSEVASMNERRAGHGATWRQCPSTTYRAVFTEN